MNQHKCPYLLFKMTPRIPILRENATNSNHNWSLIDLIRSKYKNIKYFYCIPIVSFLTFKNFLLNFVRGQRSWTLQALSEEPEKPSKPTHQLWSGSHGFRRGVEGRVSHPKKEARLKKGLMLDWQSPSQEDNSRSMPITKEDFPEKHPSTLH